MGVRKEAILLIISLLVLSAISFASAAYEYNLSYDSNGNLIQNDEYYFEYNSFNELKRVRNTNCTRRYY